MLQIEPCVCGASAVRDEISGGYPIVKCSVCWNETPKSSQALHPDAQIVKWNDLMRELKRLKAFEDSKKAFLANCIGQRLVAFDNSAVNELVLRFEYSSIVLEAEVHSNIPRIIVSCFPGEKSDGHN